MPYYKSVSKCIMGLRDKVALVHTALCILFISQAFCMPKTKKNIKGINKYCNTQNRIKQEKANIENSIDSLFKKYNFPVTEFATGFEPSNNYDFHDFNHNALNEAVSNNNAFHKFTNKNARKIANKAKKAQMNLHRKLDNTLEATPLFAPSSNCGNCPYFPEVEYPMTATDIWKPTYWGDFFETAGNIGNNGYEICKPCEIDKNKYKSNFKIIKVPEKPKPTQPVKNYTYEEVCPITIHAQTTLAPYFNNFIVKEATGIKPADEDVTPNISSVPIHNKSAENSDSSEQHNSDSNEQSNIDLVIPNTDNSFNDSSHEPEKSICVENANDTSTQEKPAQDTSESKENIELDEEFTTDEPEYAFALSTPLPFSTVETWKETQVIDPYKSLAYPDELDDYFIAVKG
ncbi:uncharacterized protein LOC121729947 [Aricia agestis]|uniref:uncharacterized protein LOC121729947 n=1 Tax=Aricia agestis TaxID=91739 RepID=UPI001C20B77C|nr:uncharacterized protein LOC121729947 [Aricia agestis]